MRQRLVWVGLLVVPWLAGCGGGGGGPKDVMKQKLDALEEAARILENVYSESDAPATKPHMQRLGKQLRELDQQIAALPADQRAELEKKYQAGIDQAIMRIKNKEMRMRAIPGGRDAYNELAIK